MPSLIQGKGLVLLLFPRAVDRAGLASLAPGRLFLSDAGLRLGPPWRLPKGPPKAKWTPALRWSRLEAL